MVSYKKENIQKAFSLLNSLEIRGIDNARRIAVISEILNNPEEEKQDGSKDEEI